jgi:hypothetical protein
MVKAKKIKASSSKYSKKSVSTDSEEPIEDYEEDYKEENEEDFSENEEDYAEEPLDTNPVPTPQGHIRSNGLFDNVWWKKGLLKGIILWLAVVVIFYLFDVFGLVQVIDWKRWAFFLVFLAIIGMAYEKFMAGRIQI